MSNLSNENTLSFPGLYPNHLEAEIPIPPFLKDDQFLEDIQEELRIYNILDMVIYHKNAYTIQLKIPQELQIVAFIINKFN